MCVCGGGGKAFPRRLLNLSWKHISPVKEIWLDLERGIHKQHKAALDF